MGETTKMTWDEFKDKMASLEHENTKLKGEVIKDTDEVAKMFVELSASKSENTKLKERVAEYLEKGESLCQQNGELLMEIARLKEKIEVAEILLSTTVIRYDNSDGLYRCVYCIASAKFASQISITDHKETCPYRVLKEEK